MSFYSVIMIVFILAGIAGVLIAFLRPDPLADLEVKEEIDVFDLGYLIKSTLEYVNDYQNLNVEELDMNKQNIEKIAREQDTINSAEAMCAYGDKDSKHFLKEFVKTALTKNFGVAESTIEKIIRFDDYAMLSDRDLFDSLLYVYKKKFGKDAMNKLFALNKWDLGSGTGYQEHYVVTTEQLKKTFNVHVGLIDTLTYEDKLEILVQRIYSSVWGLGCIDEMLDMSIDGINCGTNGIPAPMYKYFGDIFNDESGSHPLASFNAVWCFYKGKYVHLAFLGFDTEKEFERVAKKIYKYDNPGTLSASLGGIVNYRMDGSRVTVVRPPAAENWAFFVRNLDAGATMDIVQWFEGLKDVKDKGIDRIVDTLHWIISGCLNLAITGEQGCGKTTLMMSLIAFVRKSFSIRTQEMSFELNLKRKYPDRNILAFRDTPTFSGQQGLDIQKKTDGSVNLMGEVATHLQGYLTIQTGETGSNQVMFTGHMKTAELMVAYFRDCVCNEGGMSERSAEALCAKVLNTNLHLLKDVSGHRHAERITMVVPHVMEDYPTSLEEAQKAYYYRPTDRPVFDTVDLIRYEDEEYHFTGEFSEEMIQKISVRLTPEELYEFKEFLTRMHTESAAYWERKKTARGGAA